MLDIVQFGANTDKEKKVVQFSKQEKKNQQNMNNFFICFDDKNVQSAGYCG